MSPVEVPPNDDWIDTSSPSTENTGSDVAKDLGDIPPELFGNENNLSPSLTMKTETASPRPTSLRDPIVLLSSDDDDDEFDLFPSSSKGQPSKLGSRNEIFGYRFASRYLFVAFFGKNGHSSNEKVYDKDFVTDLSISTDVRDKTGDVNDLTLVCNKLKIHSIKPMRMKGTNSPRKFIYKNGGVGYYNVFVRVLSKSEVRNNMDTDLELWNWLEDIRKVFNNTPTNSQYSMPYLANGGVLGRTRSRERTLDEVLLDGDVADYAKMVYAKYYKDGSLIQRRSKVLKFFSVGNQAAANNLLS